MEHSTLFSKLKVNPSDVSLLSKYCDKERDFHNVLATELNRLNVGWKESLDKIIENKHFFMEIIRNPSDFKENGETWDKYNTIKKIGNTSNLISMCLYEGLSKTKKINMIGAFLAHYETQRLNQRKVADYAFQAVVPQDSIQRTSFQVPRKQIDVKHKVVGETAFSEIHLGKEYNNIVLETSNPIGGEGWNLLILRRLPNKQWTANCFKVKGYDYMPNHADGMVPLDMSPLFQSAKKRVR